MNYADLETAIMAVFASINASSSGLQINGQGKTKCEVAFEAFLLTCSLEAAQRNGWAIRLVPGTGNYRAPANKCKIKNTPSKFSYAEFDVGPRTKYHLLTAVLVDGASANAELEADVLVLQRRIANNSRVAKVNPPFPSLKIIIEAKKYTAGFGRMEAKSFLGMCYQLKRHPCIAALVGSSTITAKGRVLLENNTGFIGSLQCFDKVTPLNQNLADKEAFVAKLAADMKARL